MSDLPTNNIGAVKKKKKKCHVVRTVNGWKGVYQSINFRMFVTHSYYMASGDSGYNYFYYYYYYGFIVLNQV